MGIDRGRRRSCLQKGDLGKVTAESSVRWVSAQGEMGGTAGRRSGAQGKAGRPTMERARERGRGKPSYSIHRLRHSGDDDGVTYLSRSQRSRPLSLSPSLPPFRRWQFICRNSRCLPSLHPLLHALLLAPLARRLSFGGERGSGRGRQAKIAGARERGAMDSWHVKTFAWQEDRRV